MSEEIKVGDTVRCVDAVEDLKEGMLYEVFYVTEGLVGVLVGSDQKRYYKYRFELHKEEQMEEKKNGVMYTFGSGALKNVDLHKVAKESMEGPDDVILVSFKEYPNHVIVLIHEDVEIKAGKIEDEREVDSYWVGKGWDASDWSTTKVEDQFEKLGVTFISPNTPWRFNASKDMLVHRRWLPAIYKLVKRVKDAQWDRTIVGPEVHVTVERQSFK